MATERAPFNSSIGAYILANPGTAIIEGEYYTIAQFSPLDLFSLGEEGAYYDVSDLSSMFQDSAGTTPAALNQPVGRVNDLSGNGHHLLQATTSLKPILKQDGAGKYYLEADGVDDLLIESGSTTINSPAYIAAASRFLTNGGNTGNHYYFGPFASGSRIDLLARVQATPLFRVWAFTRFGGGTQNAPFFDNLVDWSLPIVHESAVAVNGVTTVLARDSAGAEGSATDSVNLPGAGPATANMRLFGSAASIVIRAFYGGIFVARALTSPEVDSVRDWLGSKNGVTF